jgi:hypothetical protein
VVAWCSGVDVMGRACLGASDAGAKAITAEAQGNIYNHLLVATRNQVSAVHNFQLPINSVSQLRITPHTLETCPNSAILRTPSTLSDRKHASNSDDDTTLQNIERCPPPKISICYLKITNILLISLSSSPLIGSMDSLSPFSLAPITN